MWSIKAKCQGQIIIFRSFYSILLKHVIIDLIVFLLLSFIKTKLLPFAIVSLFGVALLAVSARIWLPGDMSSPAPIN